MALGGLYLWYAKTYGNAQKISVPQAESATYEWQSIASDNGITGDYLWSRTDSVMIEGGSDGVLIPSYYVVRGRLNDQVSMESGIYNLRDQAYLLQIYTKQGSRTEATALMNEVFDRFASSDSALLVSSIYADFYEGETSLEGLTSISDNMLWLDAFLNYYSIYGTSADFNRLEALIACLFDESGMPIPEDLSVEAYIDNAYIGVTDDEMSEMDVESSSSLSSINEDDQEGQEESEASSNLSSYVGVKLSSIRLSMIKTLQDNGLLPAGSYETLLQLVLDSKASEELPLFAYAYYYSQEGELLYVYESDTAATIDVIENVATMRNLASVDALPSDSYAWLKSELMNYGYLLDSYSFVNGCTTGDKATDAYSDVLEIAYMMEDYDLFERVCKTIGMRVATYSSSEVLSMIFRSSNNRYICYSSDNLGVYIVIM